MAEANNKIKANFFIKREYAVKYKQTNFFSITIIRYFYKIIETNGFNSANREHWIFS